MRLTLDEMMVKYPSEMTELASTMRSLYVRAVTSGSYDVEAQEVPYSVRITNFFDNRLGNQPTTDVEFLQPFASYEADELCLKAEVKSAWNDVWNTLGVHGYHYTYYFDQVFMGWCWRGQ